MAIPSPTISSSLKRSSSLPCDASIGINYIPSPIIFIMRREQPCNLVDLISEHVRDMEMERIRARQQKYLEANHQAIQKERNAKRSLVEMEEPQEEDCQRWSLPKSNGQKSSIENSFIGGWNDSEQEEFGAKTARPSTHTHAVRRRSYRQRIPESENLIPQLKNLLRRLESPERKKQHAAQHQFSSQNFNIELVRDLASKRKHTVKVSDILKLQENWVSCPINNGLEEGSMRPLRSANQRLNLNSAHTARQTVYPFRMPSQQGSRNRLDLLKEEQIVQLIKKKRLQQSAKKRPKQPTASANIVTTPRREYSSIKRYNPPREKLTLINLLQ